MVAAANTSAATAANREGMMRRGEGGGYHRSDGLALYKAEPCGASLFGNSNVKHKRTKGMTIRMAQIKTPPPNSDLRLGATGTHSTGCRSSILVVVVVVSSFANAYCAETD